MMTQPLVDIGDSLFYRVLDVLHGRNWCYAHSELALSRLSVSADQFPHTAGKVVYGQKGGRGWAFQGDAATVQAGTVDHFIDYRNGWVICDEAPSEPVTATFREFQVTVLDAWPADEELDHIDLPVIATEVRAEDSTPYGVGTNGRFLYWDVRVEVLTAYKSQCRDLASQLAEDLKSVPMFNYAGNHPLNYDGSLNAGFDRTEQFVGWVPCAPDRYPRITFATPKRGQSEKLQNRAVIDLALWGTSYQTSSVLASPGS